MRSGEEPCQVGLTLNLCMGCDDRTGTVGVGLPADKICSPHCTQLAELLLVGKCMSMGRGLLLSHTSGSLRQALRFTHLPTSLLWRNFQLFEIPVLPSHLTPASPHSHTQPPQCPGELIPALVYLLICKEKKSYGRRVEQLTFQFTDTFFCKAPKTQLVTVFLRNKTNLLSHPSEMYVSFFLPLFPCLLFDKHCYLYLLRMRSSFSLTNVRKALVSGRSLRCS